MIKGSPNGTSGWPRVQWGPWLALALVGLVFALVNATSRLMEFERSGVGIDLRAPFLWEFSSLALILAFAPLIGTAVRRLPPRRDNWPRFLLVHGVLVFPFSAAHVAGMVAIRKAVYALAGGAYDFSQGALARELFYEWRKDVLTYALVAAVYWIFQRRNEAAASGDDRIEIRDGGAAVFLAPRDVLFVEAAGNYVEFHTAQRAHLVRGTLAAWEAKLTRRGFARVHRSRLVNRVRIGAVRPTPSGDVEITLDDGRTLLGSRRYRAALEAASAAP